MPRTSLKDLVSAILNARGGHDGCTMVGMLPLKNGRFFDLLNKNLLSGDPSRPKFLTGTSHLYSKPIPANRIMFSDLELDIGKFGFETFLYFGQFCILL